MYEEELVLSKRQQECVEYKGDAVKNLIIKGAAGAGKSVVIIKRAKQYMQDYEQGKKNHLAVFSYTNTLVSYLKEVLAIDESKKEFATISTLDYYLTFVFSKMGVNLGNEAYDSVKHKCMQQALVNHEIKYGTHRFQQLDIDFWLEECAWMRGKNIDITDREEYLLLKREGRGSNIRMSKEDRIQAFNIYLEYCEALKKKHVYERDQIYLYLTHNIEKIPENYKFDYVLIDEAQDQTLTKMIALKALAKKTNNAAGENITIAMDMNQRIYAAKWKLSDINIKATTKKLEIPFRCSIEIDALAESLRQHNDIELPDEDRGIHVVPPKHGDSKPVFVKCASLQEEKEFLIALVKNWLDKYPNHSIGILGRTNYSIGKYAEWLADAGIYYEEIAKGKEFSLKSPGVKLATIYSAKGLEFMRVIIPQFKDGELPHIREKEDAEIIKEEMVKMRSLAYVAMTRAKFHLVMSYHGKKSQFMDEMDISMMTILSYNQALNINVLNEKEADEKTESIIQPIRKIKKLEDESNLSSQIKNESTKDSLIEFLQKRGYQCVDKRDSIGGNLWVLGDMTKLKDDLVQIKKIYNVEGKFGRGRVSGYKDAWYTDSDK